MVPRVHTQKQAYIPQGEGRRVIFVIPQMDESPITGTAGVEYKGDPKVVEIKENEVNYLLKAYNTHSKKQSNRDGIAWTYFGMCLLCDGESDSPRAITCNYALNIHNGSGKAPLLSMFSGKLTIYCKLAKYTLEKLTSYYQDTGPTWTEEGVLPGGTIEGNHDDYAARLRHRYPFLTGSLTRRYTRTYDSNSELLLGNAGTINDLGEGSGCKFCEAELKYLVGREWARHTNDVL